MFMLYNILPVQQKRVSQENLILIFFNIFLPFVVYIPHHITITRIRYRGCYEDKEKLHQNPYTMVF